MIYLLHGNNLVASRNFLTALKKKYSQTKNFSTKNIQAVIDHLTIPLLFGGQELVIIEGFDKEWLEKIKGINTSKDLVIWSDKVLSSPPAGVKILEFKETFKGNAFKLADYVGEKDLKKSLEMLKSLEREKVPVEIIVGTLFRQFKLLLGVKEKEPLGVPDFVKNKINKQADGWEVDQLVSALKLLLSLDVKIKTGRIKPDLGLTQLLAKIIDG